MAKLKSETEIVEVRLPLLPSKYRYTGEYKCAELNDYIMVSKGVLEHWEVESESAYPHHIIEKIEWVPQPGETFYIVDVFMDVCEIVHSESSLRLIRGGNYFKTIDLAEAALVKVTECLKESVHDNS